MVPLKLLQWYNHFGYNRLSSLIVSVVLGDVIDGCSYFKCTVSYIMANVILSKVQPSVTRRLYMFNQL